ncbi:MAG: polysaccharide deacetylase family protein [Planctomycetaceae bacterium]
MFGKKNLLAVSLERTGVNRLMNLWGCWRGVLVLNYHRIGSPQGTYFDHGIWSASAENFEHQIEWCKQETDLIGLADLDRELANPKARATLITFDDGYIDNYQTAFPILKRHQAPAVFFLTSGFLDDGRAAWWDQIAWIVRASLSDSIPENPWTKSAVLFDEPHRNQAIQSLLQVYKSIPWDETAEFLAYLGEVTGVGACPRPAPGSMWMTWDMVRTMRDGGMTFGAHTVRHPILARLSRDEQWREISISKLRVEQELSQPVESFSYPVGAADCFNDDTMSCLKEAGFRWSFSFYGNYARPGHSSPLNIPRIAIDPHLSTSRFRSMLTLPQVFT